MILQNNGIKISKLGEERSFVSGTKNWKIEWAEISGVRFKVGDKVLYYDNDDNEIFIGVIDWMIITEKNNVEVSISDTPLGRVNLEDIEHFT